MCHRRRGDAAKSGWIGSDPRRRKEIALENYAEKSATQSCRLIQHEFRRVEILCRLLLVDLPCRRSTTRRPSHRHLSYVRCLSYKDCRWRTLYCIDMKMMPTAMAVTDWSQ